MPGSQSASRSAAIAAELRDEILRGQYREGERLPSERDLAERFGVHRTVRSENAFPWDPNKPNKSYGMEGFSLAEVGAVPDPAPLRFSAWASHERLPFSAVEPPASPRSIVAGATVTASGTTKAPSGMRSVRSTGC